MLGGEKAAVAFHGDHRPASIYVDGQVISEPAESTQEGTALTFDRTYNDRAEVSVFGESTQETLTGSNLFNKDLFKRTSTNNGMEVTNNGDGSFTITGTTRSKFASVVLEGFIRADSGTFTIVNDSEDDEVWVGYYTATNHTGDYDGDAQCFVYGTGSRTYERSKSDRPYARLAIGCRAIKEYNVTIHPQVNDGSVARPFEPYCGGIPAPNPSYPMPIESRAAACVETSNADGSKTSTTDLTPLLGGRELRSLPDGTRDELQVRDNGDGTGDVVLVERCDASMFDDAKSWSELGGSWKLATPTETVLGTIPMPETFYDTTHVWEANGADISARVRIMP